MRFAFLALSAAALATLAGCSDPPLIVPDGAFTLTTIQDMPTECTIAGHTSQVGVITPFDHNTTVKNGENGATVACTVSGTSPFDVTGNIVQDDKTLHITIASITASASETTPAVGTLSYSSAKTAGNVYSGPCNYFFTASSQESVLSGRIWVSFQCAALKQGTMSTCPVQSGTAVFENCGITPVEN